MSYERYRSGGLGLKTGIALALGVFAVWSLAPIVWMVMTSFMRQRALIVRPPDFSPASFTLANVTKIIGESDMLWQGILNSAAVALLSTAIALALGAPAAYALARLRLPKAGAISFLILATQMLPGIAVAIPLFLIISRIGMIDHIVTLALVYLTFNLPIVIWILRGFFLSIPDSIEKAAAVDGAGVVQTFVHIILPISRPPLAAAAIFAFVEAWNEFFFALILTRRSVQTVPLVISQFQGQYQTAFGQMMAAALISVLPVILLAIVFRNHIIRGFADGMSKG